MTFAVALAVVAAVLAVPQTSLNALDELAWLEGEWHRTSGGGEAIERWQRNGDGLVGEGLVIRGDETSSVESLLLVEMAGEVFYIAKPRQNPYPVAFRLVSREDGAFVFENAAHDFPQRITYRRNGDDAMTAVIEGPGEDGGEPRRLEFSFTRR